MVNIFLQGKNKTSINTSLSKKKTTTTTIKSKIQSILVVWQHPIRQSTIIYVYLQLKKALCNEPGSHHKFCFCRTTLWHPVSTSTFVWWTHIDLWTDALDLVDITRFSGLENACNFIQKSQLFIFLIDSCRVATNLMVVMSSCWVLKLHQEERLKKTVPFTAGLQEGQDCNHVSLQGMHLVFHAKLR